MHVYEEYHIRIQLSENKHFCLYILEALLELHHEKASVNLAPTALEAVLTLGVHLQLHDLGKNKLESTAFSSSLLDCVDGRRSRE